MAFGKLVLVGLVALAGLSAAADVSPRIWYTTNNNNNLGSSRIMCFGYELGRTNNNNSNVTNTSEYDICLAGLVAGLIILIAFYPFVLGLEGNNNFASPFALKRRDPVYPVEFQNPAHTVQDPHSQFAQKKSPSLKEKFSRAVDSFTAKLSQAVDEVQQQSAE